MVLYRWVHRKKLHKKLISENNVLRPFVLSMDHGQLDLQYKYDSSVVYMLICKGWFLIHCHGLS